MLFNSLAFLFIFLPLCIGAFILVAGRSQNLAVGVLAVASLIFYGWFDVTILPLIMGSIAFNYGASRALILLRSRHPERIKMVLVAAIAINLALLGYFKYTNFFLSAVSTATGHEFPALNIILPLGISFFTFTQIAFLADVAQGKAQEYDFLRYVLFVTYFPHLIAGPILHHGEMMPQFARFGRGMRLDTTTVALGVTCFAIGLLKKLGLADTIAPIADVVFSAASAKASLSMAEAWTGALAYTLQIYFDFSGYCDMAIGLSLLFGVRLPVNFNSPYKATSIIEFWRRWHMTLSRFLRDYLYFSLGGNRRGPWRRHMNLMATMVLGGLWHGAGWTFVVWGTVHGAFLIVNHMWRATGLRLGRIPSWAMTFTCVIFAWVVFRADSMESAEHMIRAMLSFDGLPWPQKVSSPNELVQSRLTIWAKEAALLAIVIAVPNTQQILAEFSPVLDRVSTPSLPRFLQWQPTATWGLVVGLALVVGIALIGGDSPFLYFQF